MASSQMSQVGSVLLLIVLLGSVVGASDGVRGEETEESCERTEEVTSRHCLKRCYSDADCVSSKKKCLCDGVCGRSCINPNLRCPRVDPKMEHGRVEIIPYNKFGAVAKYFCTDGYKLFGITHRVCQGNEKWSGDEPRCDLNRDIDQGECRTPPVVHHALNNGGEATNFPLGTMLRYTCQADFSAPAGSIATAWCVGGGVWVGPNMTCAHAGCPLLPPIDFGAVEIIPPNMIGSKARYSCLPGYYLAGRSERTCTPDGSWDGNEPSCERVACGEPPDFPHASHDAPRGQDSFPSGTQLQYDCEFGFYRDGYPKAMCSGDGEWIGPRLTCSPRSCGYPGDVLNGWRDGYKYSFPSRVTYHCNDGYELIGRPHRACSANGEWSGSLPNCRPVVCSKLNAPEFGTASPTAKQFSYGSEISFSCREGYRVIGSSKRRCQADGAWSGQDAICQEINCGRQAPLWNGYLDGHKTTVGAVFFFRCNVRTVFDGPSFSTQCLENGKWSQPIPKCWGQCQVPAISNGTVVKGREGVWVDHGTSVQFSCRNGLVLNDTAQVKCVNGTWSVIPRCKPAACVTPPPIIPNGRRVFFGQEHSDRARYSCLVGHNLRGDRYLRCHYGKWIGQKPICQEAYCPNPGELENGQIYKRGYVGKFPFERYITSIRHGEKLEYECDRGFKLNGPSGATCVNTQWSPKDKPRCVPGRHPILHKPWLKKKIMQRV